MVAEDAGGKEGRKALEEVLFSGGLWSSSPADVKKRFEPEENDEDQEGGRVEIGAELRQKLREQGFDLEDFEEEGAFQGLSKEQLGVRSPGGVFSLLGREIGETVIRSKEGSVSDVSISIYNRGDDGNIRKSKYEEERGAWKDLLDEKLAVRAETRKKTGVVAVTGWMWKKGDSACLLEGSMTRRDNRAEFIRLRMAPVSSAGSKRKVVRRASLVDNVVTDKKTGDVYIKNVPMVDQGQKGYCVVATVERVGRYFGLEVDQHELAQFVQADEYGTDGDDMGKAFKRLTGKIHVRTLRHMEYDDRQFEKDFKSYNRIAKREGVWYDKRDFDDWYLDPRYFWSKADKEVFREMKGKQNQFTHFQSKIQSYIDQGIPICWTLYLGMYKEKDTPQSFGGHMRLIKGYNKEKGEIIYSDSWGEGHGTKRMPAVEAWCMTMGLYSMIPNR